VTKLQLSLLAAFLEGKVDFAVVGGVAVILHGYVRTTSDLDLFIRPTEENALAAFHALLAVGVLVDDLEPADLLNAKESLTFGSDEDHIDILASIGDLPFDQVWRNRVETEIEGLAVPIISRDDLIENKTQIGRLRDLADVEELTAIQRSIPER
jgi:hypothetical protein